MPRSYITAAMSQSSPGTKRFVICNYRDWLKWPHNLFSKIQLFDHWGLLLTDCVPVFCEACLGEKRHSHPLPLQVSDVRKICQLLNKASITCMHLQPSALIYSYALVRLALLIRFTSILLKPHKTSVHCSSLFRYKDPEQWILILPANTRTGTVNCHWQPSYLSPFINNSQNVTLHCS